MASGRLSTVDRSVIWLQLSAEAPDGMAGTFRLADDACVFQVPTPSTGAPAGSRHCAVHATLGHDALPASCQHFPRVCLLDARGVRVALSQFCPTAAAMLVDDPRPVTIVHGPPAVPGVAVPEGLDVRDALPPRLNDRVLMDLEALTAWEAHIVGALAGEGAWPGRPEDVLARLAAEAAHLAEWVPGDRALVEVVRGLDGGAPVTEHGANPAWTPARAHALASAACRAPWTWPALPADLAALDAVCVAPMWPAMTPVVRRYLAGKAFGAWVSYQADATRALVSYLALALTVLRVECARACAEDRRWLDRERLVTALRQADLLLVHYADGGRVADELTRR